ncbi:hypothetical protein ACFZC3_15365 [Streptomyces sp. NPDC007903]|uniref:hypothetical protein n=1 Tax=Streptomyces sp. NPDC007903 TaxID=3364786 RepID=UPI0036E45E8E
MSSTHHVLLSGIVGSTTYALEAERQPPTSADRSPNRPANDSAPTQGDQPA